MDTFLIFLSFIGASALAGFIFDLFILTFEKASKVVKLWRETRKLKKQILSQGDQK